MVASGPFKIVEHVAECQHIREYPRATATEQEEVLHLAVKQYIPLDNPNPQPGDITIIGAHANGFPKVRTIDPYLVLNIGLTGYRSSMSRYGKRYMPGLNTMDFEFGLSGFRMWRIKDRAVC
jgi:hypothetical protein